MKEQELISLVLKTLLNPSLKDRLKVASCIDAIEKWQTTHPKDITPKLPGPGDETGADR